MSVLDRPFAGNWQPNRRPIIQYTPDILVYVNGDTSLPGCRTCHHNIDLQEFVTSVSVDCGVEGGASSASISLSVPRIYGDSMFRDGNTILRPGMEIHIYARGYFPMTGLASPTAKVGNVRLADIPQYPYYPVFHGVVTGVGHQLSGGYHSATLSCAGMLHFWQYMKISTQGSFFGSRPQNSRVRPNLHGHPYHGMTPYAIMYSLYRNTTGAAAGVGFALQSRTNFHAASSTTRDSLFGLSQRYWERRFRDGLYGLRMHGASGQLFTASQQAFLSQYQTSSAANSFISANLGGRGSGPDPYAQDRAVLLGLADRRDGRVLRQPDVQFLPSAGGGSHGLNVTSMQAFVYDIGAVAQVSFFESTYESKLDVAGQVTAITGYEFYQDVDGDLVFKPPLYNLDTSSSRVYRIEPIDIMDISFNEGEPEATYVVIKGGAMANLHGAVDEAEWGMRSVYVDYRGVAQFGWREHTVETAYFTSARSGFFAGVAQLDRINAGTNSATVTIPMRPEIRPGYPVYIPSIDCFYYVQSLSHAFNFGSQPTTTLNLVARRRKFLPPGVSNLSAGQHGVDTVDLANTAGAPRMLQTLTTEGVPRILGFPNVVMALDPTNINPQFFVYGFQAEDSVLTTGSDRQIQENRGLFVRSFIQVLVANNLIGLSSTVPATANPMAGPWTLQQDDGEALVLTEASLQESLGLFVQLRDRARTALPVLQARLETLQTERVTLENNASRNPAQERRYSTTLPSDIAQTELEIRNLQANFGNTNDRSLTLAASRRQVAATVESVGSARLPPGHGSTRAQQRTPEQIDGVAVLTYLINQARPQTTGPGQRDVSTDPTGVINESAAILDLLNDRKASMSINVPGYYRYYSASHPNRDQQGYAPISLTVTPAGTNTTTVTASRSGGSRQPPDPRLTTAVQGRQVARLQTVVDPVDAVRNLTLAWTQLRGRPPTEQELSVLLGQWAYETSAGTRMYNFNYGGIKAFGNDRYYEALTHETGVPTQARLDAAIRALQFQQGDAESTAKVQGGIDRLRRGLENHDRTPVLYYIEGRFRGNASAEQGATAYVQQLLRGRYRRAVDSLGESSDTSAAYEFVARIQRAGYFTGNLADYQSAVDRYSRQALEEWIPAAQSAGAVALHGAPPPPAEVPSVAPDQSAEAPPEDDFQTVQVVTADNVEGVTPELQEDLVSLRAGTPQYGLRVRTSLGAGTQVVPTSQIFTLTFEERGIPRTAAQSTVVLRDGTTVTQARQDFQACLANPPQAEALARAFAEKVGPQWMDSVGVLGSELVRMAVEGIENLKDGAGTPISSRNIANGVPNNLANLRAEDVSASPVRGRTDAEAILLEKAQALLIEVTQANREVMDRIVQAVGNARVPPTDALDPLRPWAENIALLFRGRGVPTTLPFHTEYRTQYTPRSGDTSTFSPVFPVSDARGYEHYGSYQYGRGLSIEPGGNYERLMALDPFQYASPEAVSAFVRAVRTSPITRDAQGNIVLPDEVRRRLQDIAGESSFQQSTGGQIALQWAENQGSERTAMIAAGLANFILSDRDSVTKLSVNNVAFGLADLAPQGEQDTCACRGAEADLLLAAYAAGANDHTFVSVEGGVEGQAAQWLKNQLAQRSSAWSLAQQALRGQGEASGRRSILDRVNGWQTLIGGVSSATGDSSRGLTGELNNAVTSGTNRLDNLVDRI